MPDTQWLGFEYQDTNGRELHSNEIQDVRREGGMHRREAVFPPYLMLIRCPKKAHPLLLVAFIVFNAVIEEELD